MSSREITLRIEEHWYDPLSKQLKGETLEEHLEDVLDELCDQIPQREYDRISVLIWRETQQDRLEQDMGYDSMQM